MMALGVEHLEERIERWGCSGDVAATGRGEVAAAGGASNMNRPRLAAAVEQRRRRARCGAAVSQYNATTARQCTPTRVRGRDLASTPVVVGGGTPRDCRLDLETRIVARLHRIAGRLNRFCYLPSSTTGLAEPRDQDTTRLTN